MLHTQLIDIFTDLYVDKPCIQTYGFSLYVVAHLSMYYFWLGRLHTIFHGSTWEVSFSTRKIGIIMATTSLISCIVFYPVQLANDCENTG